MRLLNKRLYVVSAIVGTFIGVGATVYIGVQRDNAPIEFEVNAENI